MLTNKQVEVKYGKASKEAPYLTQIELPYPLKLAWDRSVTIKKLSCHRLIAGQLLAVFKEILQHYGIEKVRELELDVTGGCFNYRPMRGGTSLSKHAWGIAIDMNPNKNGLKTKWKDAQFSRPEYQKFVEIFYKYGFINLGKEKNFDAMHFEISS